MDPDLADLLDRIDGVERGTPAWVNLTDALVTRVRDRGTGAPSGEVAVGDDEIVLRGLSPSAHDAFAYGVEQCKTYGMEFFGGLIGYPDEAGEVWTVVQEALQKWREAKDGTGAPPAVVVEADDEAAPEGVEAAT